MGYCTVADVAAFLQVSIAADSAAALAAIDEATAAISEYCEQPLDLVADDEHTCDVEGRQTKLFLPELPVTEVSEVVENGVTLDAADYKLGSFGILHRIGAYWHPGIQTVTVTYTHGYEAVPEIVKDVCVRAAARRYQAGLRAASTAGAAGVQAQTLGAYSVTFASEQGGSNSEGGGALGASAAPILLPSERRWLNRFKKERV